MKNINSLSILQASLKSLADSIPHCEAIQADCYEILANCIRLKNEVNNSFWKNDFIPEKLYLKLERFIQSINVLAVKIQLSGDVEMFFLLQFNVLALQTELKSIKIVLTF